MSELDRTPTFNLKVVLNETGLKADTIRAWERRYSLPQPYRSDGGHRLYSEYDIHLLKWLIARQAEGLSISRAADLWRRLIEEGQDPFDRAEADTPQTARAVYIPVQGSAISQQRDAWLAACISFDEQLADRTLTEALASYPPEMVCLEVLAKGLSLIGDRWHQGRVTVPQEHFASALAIRRLQALTSATSGPTRKGRILVACPPEEEHVFSALVVTYLLKRSGWDVVYLGANVPTTDIESVIDRVRPDLAILSAQRLATAASLADMADVVASRGVLVAYGGWIFNQIPPVRGNIRGHFLAERLEGILPAVEGLIGRGALTIQAAPLSAEYQSALVDFIAYQLSIEKDVRAVSVELAIPQIQSGLANMYLSRDILAALRLGDISYIETDIHWLTQILASRGMPASGLTGYLRTYLQVARRYLTGGHPVLVWLDSYA